MGMDAKPIVYSISKADKEWAHFPVDLKALLAGTFKPKTTPKKEITQAELERLMEPEQEKTVKRYQHMGFIAPGETIREQFLNLTSGMEIPSADGKRKIRMLDEDRDMYAWRMEQIRYNHEHGITDPDALGTQIFSISDDLDEYLELNSCEFSDTADNVLESLKYTDIAYGSFAGSFDPFQDNDGMRVLESLGFETPEDIADRDRWLTLYNSFTQTQWESAAQKLASEYDWDIKDAKELIADVLTVLKPLVKKLKEQEDSVFLLEVNGGIDFPPKLKAILQKRAEKHYKEFESILNTK